LGKKASVATSPLDGIHAIPLGIPDVSGESASGQTPELAHLAVIVGLVWRTVVMWMVLLALLTLARLLG
jgi:adenosylcobinamide-phosphate synthase